ncbi:MAG: hypothetical protein ABIA92_00610 [Patescibacteria group bacterium]
MLGNVCRKELGPGSISVVLRGSRCELTLNQAIDRLEGEDESEHEGAFDSHDTEADLPPG